MNKTKIYKIYVILLKLTIVVLAFTFIYRRIFIRENIDDVLSYFKFETKNLDFYLLGIMVGILMIVNWSLETLKWRYLIKKIEKVSFIKAFYAVLSGVTVSIFTPNRIGEYAGRVFILEHADRWKGVLITMLGSFCQLLVTIVFGAIGFVFFLYADSNENIINNYMFYGLLFLITLLVIVLLLFFFNISIVSTLVNRLPRRFVRLKKYSMVFRFYHKKELAIALVLSVLRYFVFVTQFYLLLQLFDIKIPYLETLFVMSLVYVTMAAIPTIALTELGVRGSVSIYFFSWYFNEKSLNFETSDIGILSVSSLLWLLNLAFPALLGAIFVFRLKFFRKANGNS